MPCQFLLGEKNLFLYLNAPADTNSPLLFALFLLRHLRNVALTPVVLRRRGMTITRPQRRC